MKRMFKFGIAIFIYALLLIVLDFIMGIGIRDQWDKLLRWSKK